MGLLVSRRFIWRNGVAETGGLGKGLRRRVGRGDRGGAQQHNSGEVQEACGQERPYKTRLVIRTARISLLTPALLPLYPHLPISRLRSIRLPNPSPTPQLPQLHNPIQRPHTVNSILNRIRRDNNRVISGGIGRIDLSLEQDANSGLVYCLYSRLRVAVDFVETDVVL